MNNKELSELIYPSQEHSAEEYEAMYPSRDLPAGAMVTRLGPSPTGFIHLGNLYGAFVDERLAHQSGGVFYLRIEDTDDKRYVENAVETIISSLSFFDIKFMNGEQEIEPDVPVTVEISYEEGFITSEETIAGVVHYAKEGIELIEDVIFLEDEPNVCVAITIEIAL